MTVYCQNDYGHSHTPLTWLFVWWNEQFIPGQQVWLMNPRSVWQKTASRTVSGISGEHKFHFMDIPDGWIKVDVREALAPNVQLMMENRDDEQEKVKDVVGSSVLWNKKYMKSTS
jgi:hypothetical protein